MKSMITYKLFKCEICNDEYQGAYPYTFESKIVCDLCQANCYEA